MTLGDSINSVVAIATVVMALATYYLASVTRKLAEDTAAATRQADRHHQDNLRPFCVIEFDGAGQQFPFGPAFDPEYQRLKVLMGGAEQITQPATIFVRGSLRNKGNGLATDVVVYLNMRRGEGEAGALRLTRPVLISGLVGAKETIQIDVPIAEHDVMSVWNGMRWNPVQVFHAIPGDTYEVVLEYKDAFGNIFRTVHPRGIWTSPIPNVGDKATREQMMIRQDRPAPIFLAGRQGICTAAKAPSPPLEIPLDDPGGGINERLPHA
jgi:hypothetical protein